MRPAVRHQAIAVVALMATGSLLMALDKVPPRWGKARARALRPRELPRGSRGFAFEYEFKVDGRTYRGHGTTRERPPTRLHVSFNQDNPADNHPSRGLNDLGEIALTAGATALVLALVAAFASPAAPMVLLPPPHPHDHHDDYEPSPGTHYYAL